LRAFPGRNGSDYKSRRLANLRWHILSEADVKYVSVPDTNLLAHMAFVKVEYFKL
jgi:hypothetical protein